MIVVYYNVWVKILINLSVKSALFTGTLFSIINNLTFASAPVVVL